MNDADSIALQDLKKQVADLSLAVKIGFFALLLAASWFNIRITFYIPRFDLVYRDMLNGAVLPAGTLLAVRMSQWLAGLACALPAVGLVALFAKSARNSVITIGICMIAAVVQFLFTWSALSAPLFEIIRKMGADAS